MTCINFSCPLLFVGCSCGFLAQRRFAFCRKSDERDDNSGSIPTPQLAEQRNTHLKTSTQFSLQSKNLLAIPATAKIAASWPGEASRRQQHPTLGFAVETLQEQGLVPMSLSSASTALLLCQADSQPCQRTHLLCGLKTPARRLCQSHCCHCWSCQLGLLSWRLWRGSCWHSQLLSLALHCLQAGGEPSLVSEVLLGSWRGSHNL